MEGWCHLDAQAHAKLLVVLVAVELYDLCLVAKFLVEVRQQGDHQLARAAPATAGDPSLNADLQITQRCDEMQIPSKKALRHTIRRMLQLSSQITHQSV